MKCFIKYDILEISEVQGQTQCVFLLKWFWQASNNRTHLSWWIQPSPILVFDQFRFRPDWLRFLFCQTPTSRLTRASKYQRGKPRIKNLESGCDPAISVDPLLLLPPTVASSSDRQRMASSRRFSFSMQSISETPKTRVSKFLRLKKEMPLVSYIQTKHYWLLFCLERLIFMTEALQSENFLES